MKRTQILAALLGLGFGLASAANAATSVVLSASGPFTPGSVITLTTTVTQNGAEAPVTGVLGNINYPNALVDPMLASNSQVPLSTVGDMAAGWGNQLPGEGLICTTVFCVAFNQPNPLGATAGVTNLAIAQTHFLIDPATPVGAVIDFVWRTTPTTQGLSWYGVTQAPGVSVTVIPEPTTVALLGLGLIGLAVAGRRRA